MNAAERTMLGHAAAAIGMGWARWDYARLLSTGAGMALDMLWNPLRNNGNAAELAALLRISVTYRDGLVVAEHSCGVVMIRYSEGGGLAAVTAAYREAVTTMAAVVGLDRPMCSSPV